MKDVFHIQIDHSEGALQRLIGLIERRGFHIDGMSVSDAGSHRDVRVTVREREAGRCTQVLGRQIDRMVGARRVSSPASTLRVEELASCTA